MAHIDGRTGFNTLLHYPGTFLVSLDSPMARLRVLFFWY